MLKMDKVKNNGANFQCVIARLGFKMDDDCLFFTNKQTSLPYPQIQFHIEKAGELSASAVYLRKQLNGSYKPQVYLFDFTDRNFEEAMENEIFAQYIAPLDGRFNQLINILSHQLIITLKRLYISTSLTLTVRLAQPPD